MKISVKDGKISNYLDNRFVTNYHAIENDSKRFNEWNFSTGKLCTEQGNQLIHHSLTVLCMSDMLLEVNVITDYMFLGSMLKVCYILGSQVESPSKICCLVWHQAVSKIFKNIWTRMNSTANSSFYEIRSNSSMML